MSVVLVTGGSGFVGTHCIVRLLEMGHSVRTTVRNRNRQADVLRTLAEAGIDGGDRLSFHVTDMLAEAGWKEALAGCDYVLHVASPFPATAPTSADELIRPAREGTLRVLRLARDAGVRKVVITSSSVAIMYGHPPQTARFDETVWTHVEGRYVTAYAKSKTLAEQAAWDFLETEGGQLRMTVINPVGIFGPVLSKDLSASVLLIKMMLEGKMPAMPRISFGVVDVRDVAALHIRAMEDPATDSERFLAVADGILSFEEIAYLLKDQLGERARKVSTRTLPDWTIRLIAIFSRQARGALAEIGHIKQASNEKAKGLLKWQPRSKEDSILATARALLDKGFIQL